MIDGSFIVEGGIKCPLPDNIKKVFPLPKGIKPPKRHQIRCNGANNEYGGRNKRLVFVQVEGLKKLFPKGWFNKDHKQPHPEGLRQLEKFRDPIKKNDDLEKDSISLKKLRLVVLDTETTGLKPQAGDEIISIGACLVKNGTILEDFFDRLVNPGRQIPPFITELTGISEEMVLGAPKFCSVMSDLLEFIEDCVIIGHSIEFDIHFMNYKLNPYGVKIKNYYLDTGLLSKVLYPHWKIYTLDSILSKMGIEPEGRHTALGDAILTADVFLRLLKEFEELGVLTLSDLRCFIRNALMHRI